MVNAVKAKLPSTPLLLLGILPSKKEASHPLRNKIIEVNSQLAGLEGPGVSVHDVGSVLLEPDGSISEAVMGDFLHPSAQGFERLTAAVAPLVENLVSPAG